MVSTSSDNALTDSPISLWLVRDSVRSELLRVGGSLRCLVCLLLETLWGGQASALSAPRVRGWS